MLGIRFECFSFFFFFFFVFVLKVEAERTYHQRVLQILDQLEGEVSKHVSLSLMIMLFPTAAEFTAK